MMMNIVLNVMITSMIQAIWIIFFGMILLGMLALELGDIVICGVYPSVMFYGLWWGYDRSERWICRKLGIVKKI